MGGGQYPTGQLCQAFHLEMREETQMVHGPAEGRVEGAGPRPYCSGPFSLLAPSLVRLGLGGFMASLGWGQTPGFVLPPPTCYC